MLASATYGVDTAGEFVDNAGGDPTTVGAVTKDGQGERGFGADGEHAWLAGSSPTLNVALLPLLLDLLH